MDPAPASCAAAAPAPASTTMPGAYLASAPASRRYVAVEFPGIVKDRFTALAALGGPLSIARALPDAPVPADQKVRLPLELRLRASDPFAHPLAGEVMTTCNLLVKVVRRRHRATGATKMTVQVEGIIAETGRFRSLADYQWMPDPSDAVAKARNAMRDLDLSALADLALDTPHAETLPVTDLRQFPPPLFSGLEMPLHYDFRQNPAVVQVAVPTADGSTATKLVNRSKTQRMLVTSVQHFHPTPMAPDKPQLDALHNISPASVTAVRALFDARPVWTRLALVNALQALPNKLDGADAVRKLKRILPSVAYYLTSGPWKMTWVRFGFDPKVNRQTRVFQILDTRNHFKAGWVRAKRRTLVPTAATAIAPDAAAAMTAHDEPEAAAAVAGAAEGENDASGAGTGAHLFDGQRLHQMTSLFQLCDLTDPILKELVDSEEYLRETCHPVDGWYYRGVILKLRARLRAKRAALASGKPYAPPPEDDLEVVMDGTENDAQDEPDQNDANADADAPAPPTGPLVDPAAIARQVDDLMRSLDGGAGAAVVEDADPWNVFGEDAELMGLMDDEEQNDQVGGARASEDEDEDADMAEAGEIEEESESDDEEEDDDDEL
ncbi:tau 95 subunit of transcription factor TFIIIC [Allomyces arbusculus]|nr:tau 95 subunit of transcription factor TFIIIC [Allomyces arbusculus]